MVKNIPIHNSNGGNNMSAIREVKVESGLLRGVPGNNRMFSVFKGIPYAAPCLICPAAGALRRFAAVTNFLRIPVHFRIFAGRSSAIR